MSAARMWVARRAGRRPCGALETRELRGTEGSPARQGKGGRTGQFPGGVGDRQHCTRRRRCGWTCERNSRRAADSLIDSRWSRSLRGSSGLGRGPRHSPVMRHQFDSKLPSGEAIWRCVRPARRPFGPVVGAPASGPRDERAFSGSPQASLDADEHPTYRRSKCWREFEIMNTVVKGDSAGSGFGRNAGDRRRDDGRGPAGRVDPG